MAQYPLPPEDAVLGNELILLHACVKFKGLVDRLSGNCDMALLIYNMQVSWPSSRAIKKSLPRGILKLCLTYEIGESTKPTAS